MMAYIFRRRDPKRNRVGSWFLGYDVGGKRFQMCLKGVRSKQAAQRALAEFVLQQDLIREGRPADVSVVEAVAEFLA
ncbi:MAG TPA: hypothetical protein VM223_17435, partial [Planctomycetota bacterium]|nr:hypothetical protein [Planctomycetota bacterium]